MEIIKKIHTQRGAKLNIKGGADKIFGNALPSPTFSINPDDFSGSIPKLLKKEGEKIAAG